MSSNIEVQRICQHCGTEFTARTTVTKYCGEACAKRAYKARKRAEKVEQSNRETVQVKQQPIEELKAKEFLTVSQVSKLLSCSRQNVYKLINSGKLQATNLLEKKTIVRRSDLDSLFTEIPESGTIPQQQRQELSDWKEAGYFEISDCYTLTEVQEKYRISESTVQQLIKRNSIPKIKKGWYAYVPKRIIDELLT
ncbi:helix-turn-helix domain-containing protein [Nafulsella turpanensis]|uniref:helix-turn-helix domain-containing protein n=1 Tax=Nafulsella turpanensis TaxID=1265690 RepID=UPI00034A8025|nr:helix-turn-helix domain-containing protein [Nafulsella turpanensis]